MLHAARDVVPGVAELVEAHRSGSPGPHEVRDLTWEVGARGYRLLLGLRRHRDWTAIRPRAFDAALDGLRRGRSEEHTSELQSLMRHSYAVFCLKTNTQHT